MDKEYTIDYIYSLTEVEASASAEEKMVIKEHNIYFMSLGRFGYSYLVFKNGKHIYYADDYELHHEYTVKEGGKAALRKLYLDSIDSKLFTEDELRGEIKDYDEYSKKSYYLHNYYHMQKDYESIYGIWTEESKKEFREKIKNMTYNPISFCYMDDKEFVDHQIELYKQLEKRKVEMADNYEYYKKAFLYEMYNHEYGINWEADHDTLSAFGNVGWHNDDINAYFEELKFTETQRRAYMDARKQYYKEYNKDEDEDDERAAG